MPTLFLVLKVHVNLNNRNVNAVSYCVGDMLIEWVFKRSPVYTFSG